jgi:hypothetical protein
MTRIALAGTIALFLIPTAATAQVRYLVRPGVLCQPLADSRDKVDYDHRGAFNTASVPATVNCPIPTWNRTELVSAIAVVLYDGSSTAEIECTAEATDYKGDTQWFNRQSTPPGGTGLQTLAFQPTGVVLGWLWTLQCILPAQQSGEFSRVTLIRMTSTF